MFDSYRISFHLFMLKLFKHIIFLHEFKNAQSYIIVSQTDFVVVVLVNLLLSISYFAS